MKKYLSLLLAILLVFSLAACGNVDDKDTKDNTDTTAADTVKNKETPKEVYTLGDFTVEYKGAKIALDDRDYPAVIVTVDFTNNSEFADSLGNSLSTNGVQKDESMSFANLSADEYYQKTAEPGETIEVTFGYLLNPLDYDGNINYTDAVTLTIANRVAETDCTITIDPTTLTNEAVTE